MEQITVAVRTVEKLKEAYDGLDAILIEVKLILGATGKLELFNDLESARADVEIYLDKLERPCGSW
jgi:hypothetical protein